MLNPPTPVEPEPSVDTDTQWTRFVSVLGSVKLRVTLGSIVALALGIGFITFLVVIRAERDLLLDQEQRELGESVRTAQILSRRVVSLQRSLQTAARQMESMDIRDDGQVIRYLQGNDVLRGLFNGLFVISPEGKMHFLVDEKGVRAVDIDVSGRVYVRKTLDERRPVISEPIESKISGQWIVIFTMPLRGTDGATAALAASLRLASRDLLDDLTETVETDTNALMLVADSSGRILAPAAHVTLGKRVADEPRMRAAFADWLESGGALEPAGLHLRQQGELVTAAGVAGTDWMVWRARTEADLLHPLRDARKYALVWACILVAALSVALLVLLRLLLKPLTHLERRATHAVDKDMEPAMGWPECGGELGRLSKVLKAGAIERERLQVDKHHLLKMLESVLNSAPIGIAYVRDGRFELVSNEFCALFRLDKAALLDQPVAGAFAAGSGPAPTGSAADATGGDWLMARSDATEFWGQLRCSPLDPAEPSAGAIWTLVDVTSQRDAHRQLEWAATHDGLTGLPNRKLFERRAARLIAALPQSVPAAIVFLDLDRFKPINDTAGHAAGDAVLNAIAGVLSASIRSGDIAARIGGDEFALLLERCGPDDAIRVAKKVCDQIGALEVPWEGRVLRVGASAGVAELGIDSDLGDWLNEADQACYAAKAAGRGVARSAARVA